LALGLLSSPFFDVADLLVQNQPHQPGKPMSDDPDGAPIAEFADKTAEYVLEVRPFFLDGRVGRLSQNPAGELDFP
jgi:hypothetical protein